jgi:general secretion pathway protein D
MKYPKQQCWAMLLLLLAGINGCATTEVVDESKDTLVSTRPSEMSEQPRDVVQAFAADNEPAEDVQAATVKEEQLYPGSGVFVNEATGTALPQANIDGDKVTLNFENADITQVARVVFGKVLKENYVIDPGIKGQVTIQTTRPMSKELVLIALQNILKIHGAKLLYRNGVYEIVPEAKLIVGNIGVGKYSAAQGFSYQIVPLEFIAAKEMSKILEPVSKKESLIRVDEQRNLLIIAGNTPELITMIELINIFDVDWLSGKSVGLVEVQYTDASTLLGELESILGLNKDGPLSGMLQIMSIDRVNSVLVITTQPNYLHRVKEWVKRLDRPSGGDGKKFYVYQVKNGNAEELAATLNELFVVEDKGKRVITSKEATIAPDLAPMTAVTPPLNQGLSQNNNEKPQELKQKEITVMANKEDEGELSRVDTRIIAAHDTNSLLIFATPSDYHKIEAAIAKLDVAPLQVLVEASIIDLRLSGEFSYGVQWFFKNNSVGGKYQGLGQVGEDLAFSPTFSYTVTDAAGMLRGMLRMLASDGKVNVLSSPSLMVRNNQTATIRVGDQQPVSTALVSQQGNVVASSVQFKDTGVMLEVTPRINADGMISLIVNQEVTDVGEIDDATGQRSFLQRSINSSVAVNSGETLVLGGLIRENKAFVKSGVPFLKDIPLVGALFGQTVTSTTRTELIVMLTPKIVRNSSEAKKVTEEYRRKLENLESSFSTKTGRVSDSNEWGFSGQLTPTSTR